MIDFDNPIIRINQNGSATFYALFVVMAVTFLAAEGMDLIKKLNESEFAEQASKNLKSIEMTTRLIYPDRTTCTSHFAAGSAYADPAIAVDLKSEIKSKLANAGYANRNSLRFDYPGTTEAFLSLGATIQNLAVVDFRLASLQKIAGSANSYLAVTRLSVETSARPLRPISIPLYVTTDSNGNLTSCEFTSMVEGAVQETTIEDSLCESIKGPNFKFDPEGPKCISL